MGHPWPQDETLLCTVFECHIHLVSILFHLCFELLKRKPVLRCHAGVLLAVLGVGGDAGMLSDAFTCIDVCKPKVRLHPNISGAAVPTGTDWDSEKIQLWCDLVQPCFSLPISGKVMLTYVHEEISDLGEKGVIV